jgi:hypothetical protein
LWLGDPKTFLFWREIIGASGLLHGRLRVHQLLPQTSLSGTVARCGEEVRFPGL